jgi:hypothetical protein
MEYSFIDWLDGKPEPTNPLWKYDVENKSLNPVYRQIAEAKKNTFDWSLQVLFELGKSDFSEKIEGLSESQKKLYTENKIIDAKKKFEGYEIDQLIFKNHPRKFDGINGQKYQSVKQAYEDYNDGKNIGFAHLKNDFLQAILYFGLDEFYQNFLQNGYKKPQPTDLEKPEKGKTMAVRYSLLKMLGFENTPEYKSLIKERQKVAFIRFILACDESVAKGLKNGHGKYIEPRHEIEAKDLFDRIKKGDIL